MKAFRIALIALVCSVPLAALSQWQWVDQSGRKVFSDKAPPPDVPQERILRKPGQRAASAAETPAEVAPTSTAALPKPASGVDKSLEERRKQADAAEAAKRKAEADKVAAVAAENCQRAKTAKANYSSGMRIARVNDKGEREILDDSAREAEMKNIDAVITRDCAKSQ